MSEPPDLQIILRIPVVADFGIFFEQQSDPEYHRMAAFTRKDPEDRLAFLLHCWRITSDPAIILRTIIFEGEVVGSVGSFPAFGDREVTYGIARPHWGKGLATIALRSFLSIDPARPLHARAAADNARSLRVLQKCGFREIGRERNFANARNEAIEEVILRLDDSPTSDSPASDGPATSNERGNEP